MQRGETGKAGGLAVGCACKHLRIVVTAFAALVLDQLNPLRVGDLAAELVRSEFRKGSLDIDPARD